MMTSPVSRNSQQSPAQQPASPLVTRNVYISGLPTGFTSNNFRQLCQQFGKVEASKLCVDANSSPTKGYGFCLFIEAESAAACIKGLHGAVFGGRKLQARYADAAATPQPSATTAVPGPNGHAAKPSASVGGGSNGKTSLKSNPSHQQNSSNGNSSNGFVALPAGGFFMNTGMMPTVNVPNTAVSTMVPMHMSPPPAPAASGSLDPFNPLSTFTFFPPLQPQDLFLASSIASQSQSPAQGQGAMTLPSASANCASSSLNLISPLSYSLLSSSAAGSSASSNPLNTAMAGANMSAVMASSIQPLTPSCANLDLAPGYSTTQNAQAACQTTSAGSSANHLNRSPVSDLDPLQPPSSSDMAATASAADSLTGTPVQVSFPVHTAPPSYPQPQQQQFVFVPMPMINGGVGFPANATIMQPPMPSSAAFSMAPGQPFFFSAPCVGMVQQQ